MSQTTRCPGCGIVRQVDDSMIGRFTSCDHCRCMYYVVVPPLGQETANWPSIAATSSMSDSLSAAQLSNVRSTAVDSIHDQVARLYKLQVGTLLISLLALAVGILQLLR